MAWKSLIILLFLPCSLSAQSLLEKIKLTKEIAYEREKACLQYIQWIGDTTDNEIKYEMYEVIVDHGKKCVRDRKLVFTTSDEVIGFYSMGKVSNDILDDGRILWEFEDGTEKYTTISEMGFKDFEILPGVMLVYTAVND